MLAGRRAARVETCWIIQKQNVSETVSGMPKLWTLSPKPLNPKALDQFSGLVLLSGGIGLCQLESEAVSR